MKLKKLSAGLALSALVVVGGLAVATPANAAGYTTRLPAGTSLLTGDSVVSGNAQYTLEMQGDGNAVEYGLGGQVIFQTNTDGNPGARLDPQTDGNLVVYAASGKALWQSGTSGNKATQLVVGTDGNLVMYNGNTPGWSSDRTQTTLTPGSILKGGQTLKSSLHGTYTLDMQTDGNLVEYSPTNAVVWQSNTDHNPGAVASFQKTDGNFVVYSVDGKALWQSGTSGISPKSIVMRSDGDAVLYATDGSIKWQSNAASNGGLQSVAARLVADYNAGKLVTVPDSIYQKEILPAAQNGTAPAGCAVDVRILQALAMTIDHFGSAKVTSIQRTCIGDSTNCSTGSLHCASPGLAIDLSVLGGVVLNGSNSQDIAYLRYLDTIVPGGSQAGQSNCRSAAGVSISLSNMSQFQDTCNHQHFDLGSATGPVKYVP